MATAKKVEPQKAGGRNIIICCDGTSNEPASADETAGATNVVRIFRCLEKDEQQIVFYEPGVGTSGILDLWHKRSDALKALAAQATGYGLDAHITSAYRFLCVNYRKGDRISIFGFSRGAYCARVIAGLIQLIGLLRPEQSNLADYALKAYKYSSEIDDLSVGWRFARSTGARRVPVYFLGLWDTVGSMLAPSNEGIGQTYLPYTTSNAIVQRVRHAMALDEHRHMFKITRWVSTPHKMNPKAAVKGTPQDVEEVWFAGDHADVGGGHREEISGLSKVSLKWMAGEAHSAGLRIDRQMLTRLTSDINDARGKLLYKAEDALAVPQTMSKKWKAMEVIPTKASAKIAVQRHTLFGYYLPLSESRPVASGDTIHESVVQRAAADQKQANLGKAILTFKVGLTKPIS
jgi:uncharacterized protein (DUF2235 family)